MRGFVTTLVLFIWTTSVGQNCQCDKDTLLSEIINCDTTKFENGATLYWSFNCDSSWLTFESLTHKKEVLFSLGEGMQNLTGRLGYIYIQEYRYRFLIQNNVISGCCSPPDFYLFDKTTGQKKESMGRIIFFSQDKKLPFIISLTNSGYDTTHKANYNTLSIYNIDNGKTHIFKLSKGEIEKSLAKTEQIYPEYLFDEPILKGATIFLTYLLDKPISENTRRTKTIAIDLKKYSR